MKIIIELHEATKTYSHDADLGEWIRENYNFLNINQEAVKRVITVFPNDYDLGDYMRNYWDETIN